MNKSHIKYLNNPSWTPINNYDDELQTEVIPIGNKIGIIDGGINLNWVPKENIKGVKNFISGEKDCKVVETINDPHCSFVASTILDTTPGASLYIAKVFPDRSNPDGDGNVTDIIKALYWLLSTVKVKVVNMSLGFYNKCDGSCMFCKAVDALVQEFDAHIFVSAGNRVDLEEKQIIDSNFDIKKYTEITCPGAAKKVITVGSLNRELEIDKEINLQSDYAPNKPDTYYNGHLLFYSPDYSYTKTITGTSFSTPIATSIYVSQYFKELQD